jgi:hypothetical protein
MWLATLALLIAVGVLSELGLNPAYLMAVVVIVILVIAAPRRVRGLGGPGALGSDEDRDRD